ncbi:MAG: 1-acyl-sn-glycerol-3-phosphate acyltransferase [Bacteroidia bacterium]|nr:1-acyl-sn-glycerol-3-phosphate acyltransferase [Bacteroidia bacterium]
MKQLKEIIQFILAIYFGFITLIGFLVLYPGFAITLSNPKWYKYGHKLRKLWGRWLFLGGFIWVKQIEEKKFDKKAAYVITPNHTSKLDIVTLTVKLNINFNFMAKIELARVPIFGIFFRTIDIAVDRKNVRHSALAYQRACNQLIKEKRSMVIFPEGTIPGNTPKLGRFKDGAFKLAIETQTDILPVTIIKNWEILPDNGKFRFRPGKVYQYVHEPISTKGLTTNDITSLKEKVQHLIANKLNEYGYNQ